MSTYENVIQKAKLLFQAFKSMPMIPRWISIIAVFVALCAAVIGFTSCGTTRAVVHNGASGSVTEIKITTNNPTSVQASPNVQIPISTDGYVKKNEAP